MIRIGSTNWVARLKRATLPLGADLWSGFTPISNRDLARLETRIGRRLPAEFREFYRSIGYGEFPTCYGGGFYSPDEILESLGAPIFFVLGSRFFGKEWATEEEHRELWRTRARVNPDPSKFTEQALTFGDVKLYDLLEFGSDGSGSYHQIYVGPRPAPFRYCLLTEDPSLEDTCTSFSHAVATILGHFGHD